MTMRLSIFIATSILVHGVLLVAWQPSALPVLGQNKTAPMSVSMLDSKKVETATLTDIDKSTGTDSTPDRSINSEPPMPQPAVLSDKPATTTAIDENGQEKNSPPPSAEPSADEIAALAYVELTEEISRHFHYPLLARQHGWQGIVRLNVHIKPGGLVGDIQVTDSSGYRLLDNAAVRSMRQVTHLTTAADWRGPPGFDMVIPVEYRLIDG